MYMWVETAHCMLCGGPIYRHYYVGFDDGTSERLLVDHVPDPTCQTQSVRGGV
jgi:hypothetical protein